MAENTLDHHFHERVELIERRLAESFREHAELIEELFAYRFEELDKKWDATVEGRLRELQDLIARCERADSRMDSVQRDVAVIKHAVKAILTRLP